VSVAALSLLLALVPIYFLPTSATPAAPTLPGLPGLRAFNQTVLDPAVVKSDVDAGRPFHLPLGGRDVQLDLQRHNMRAAEFSSVPTTENATVRTLYPEVITYKGKVIGESDSEVRMAISNSSVEGYIVFSGRWYFVEPFQRYSPVAPSDAYLVYSTLETVSSFAYGDDAVILPVPITNPGGAEMNQSVAPLLASAGLALTTPQTQSTPSSQPEPHPGPLDSGTHYFPTTYMARIILSSDQDFRSKHSDWQSQMEIILNNVEGIFSKSAGVEFRIVREDGPTLNSGQGSDLLNEYKSVEEADQGAINTARNIAHLFTAKDLAHPLCDGVLGIAWEGGLAVSQTPEPANYAYSLAVTESTLWCGFDGGAYHRMVLHAHEIGHVFNGDHAYAVEDPPGSGKWTVMKTPFQGSNTNPYFSDGTLDGNKNNVKRIRDLSASVITTLPINNAAAQRNGGSATASCSPKYAERGPASANDERMDTYWWAGTTPCSLTVSFNSLKHITKFVIREFSSGTLITSFTIDVDTTGQSNWVQVFSTSAAIWWTYVAGIKVVDAYKIRLNVNAVCCGYTAVVREFEAYQSENLALQTYGAIASSSGDLWGHTAGLANDGQLATYWWATTTTSSLTILFDKAYATSNPRQYPITQIVVRAFNSGYAMPYWEVDSLGGDGSWNYLFSQSGGTGAVKIFVLLTADYSSLHEIKGIRLLVNGATCCGGLNSYAVIRELEAYADNYEPKSNATIELFVEYS
jgi:hypothetical protein